MKWVKSILVMETRKLAALRYGMTSLNIALKYKELDGLGETARPSLRRDRMKRPASNMIRTPADWVHMIY
jgi:hypothetical protein